MAKMTVGPTSGKMTETALRQQEQQKQDERLGRQIRARAYQQSIKVEQDRQQQEREFKFEFGQSMMRLDQQMQLEQRKMSQQQSQDAAMMRYRQGKETEARRQRAEDYQLERRKSKREDIKAGLEMTTIGGEVKARALPVSELPVVAKGYQDKMKLEMEALQDDRQREQRFAMLSSSFPELMQESGFFEQMKSFSDNLDMTPNSMMLRAREAAQQIGKDRAIETVINQRSSPKEKRQALMQLGKEGRTWDDQLRDYMARKYLDDARKQSPTYQALEQELSSISIQLRRFMGGENKYTTQLRVRQREVIDHMEQLDKLRMDRFREERLGELTLIYGKDMLPEPQPEEAQPQAAGQEAPPDMSADTAIVGAGLDGMAGAREPVPAPREVSAAARKLAALSGTNRDLFYQKVEKIRAIAADPSNPSSSDAKQILDDLGAQ